MERAEALARKKDPVGEFSILEMKKASPLSLMINFEGYRRAATMSYKEVLNLELNLVKKMFCPAHGDFDAGVKHVLLHKGKREPCWKYSSIKEVPLKIIHQFFCSNDTFDFSLK